MGDERVQEDSTADLAFLCPKCRMYTVRDVTDSRWTKRNEIVLVRRRRKCSNCHHRYTTAEMLAYDIEGFEHRVRQSIIRAMMDYIVDHSALPTKVTKSTDHILRSVEEATQDDVD